MNNFFRFPFVANGWAMFWVFIGSIVVFHVLLVYWLKLSKMWWKRIDYVWLGVAALGLIGSVSQARQYLASSYLGMAQDRCEGQFALVKSLVTTYASSGIVCRTFPKSQYFSPEESSHFQHEYDETCNWFKQINAELDAHSHFEEINWEKLPSVPNIDKTRADLLDIIRGVQRQAEFYNQEARTYQDLKIKSHRSDSEIYLLMLSPLLVCIAVALRISKVTGEIRLEKK